MRRLFILLGILVTSLVLVGCTGENEALTAPTYTGIIVEGTDPIASGEYVTYLHAKQDTVLVQINFDNPDKVAIRSVVIDGYIYLSTRFATNSTTSVVYLEVNVGDTVAETIYTVNRFSYLDGENTVNIDVKQDNEFRVYVYKDTPTVVRENYAVAKESITIDFDVTDVDSVIVENSLIAYIYDGADEVEHFPISTDSPQVIFDELDANTHYDVKIEASFNLDDGEGLQENVVLYSGDYSTISNGVPSAVIENVYVSANTVTYDVVIKDDDLVIEPGGITVYIYDQDGEIFDQKNISGSVVGESFIGLLNDNDYTIRVKADYDLDDGAGILTDKPLATHNLSTLPQDVPTPQLLNLNLLENSIEFDVYVPTNGIIFEDTIIAELYIGGLYINTATIENDHVDFQVNNLFANSEFEIVLRADYDLNDGNLRQTNKIIFGEIFSTLENDIPSVNINEIMITQGYVTVNLLVSDNDNTLTGALTAVLYEEDNNPLTDDEVAAVGFDVDTTQLVFDYATRANVSYYIEIYASYNLRDGLGKEDDSILRRIISYTAEKKAPIAEISNVVSDTSTIDFDVKVIDADLTISDGTIVAYLYLNGVAVPGKSKVIDPGDNSVTFTGLLSNNLYEIVIKANYNLVDGSGLLLNKELKTNEMITVAKALPTSEDFVVVPTEDSISFSINVIDNDSVITLDEFDEKELKAVLIYQGATVETVSLDPGNNYNIDFTTTLYSNSSYDIIIYASYNLNDGSDKQVDYPVAEVEVKTIARNEPTATIYITDITETDVTFSVDVINEDSVIIPGTTYAVLVQGDTPVVGVAPIPLTPGYNDNKSFTGLFSNEGYVIQIITDYNLLDNQPDYEGEKINSGTTNFRTVAYFPVQVNITNELTTARTIEFDVEIIDISGVIDGTMTAVLDMGLDPDLEFTLGVGTTHVVFANLAAETTYEVDILVFYDLNENGIEYDPGLLAEKNYQTLALGAPSGSINEVDRTYDTITAVIFLNNEDETITGDRVAQIWQGTTHLNLLDFDLVDGLNEALFTGLQANTEYTIKIFASYDLLDGSGEVTDDPALDTKTVTTLEKFAPNVIVSGETLTHDGVTFMIEIDDLDNVASVGTLVTATLYDALGPITSKTLYTNVVSFDLSMFDANQDFTIVISGEVNFDDGVGPQIVTFDTLVFTTLSYELPTANVTEVVINQDTLDFSVVVTDVDDVIIANLVAVLYDENDDVIIPSIDLTVGLNAEAFDITLLYEESYRLVVYADYNLYDGTGTKTTKILSEKIITIYNRLNPQAEISNVALTETSITFDVDVYDYHSTILNIATLQAELYLDGTFMYTRQLALGNQTVVFETDIDTTILSNREYEIRIVTDFDSDRFDGIEEDYLMASQLETTVAKVEPEATIIVDTVSPTEIIVDIVVDDTAGISTTRVVNFYLPGSTTPIVDLSNTLIVGNNLNKTYSLLLGSTNYTIEVVLTYDLNDGYGSVEKTVTLQQATLGSRTPVGSVLIDSMTSSTASVTYTFSDSDSVSTEQYIRIYKVSDDSLAGELAIVEGEDLTYVFTGLEPNEEYYVTVESSFNLNDLDGLQEDIAVAMSDASLTENIVSITNETIDTVSNTLDIVVDDYEDIITGYFTATLYQDSAVFATYFFTTDTVTTIDMIGLLSDFNYVLEIEVIYTTASGNVEDLIYTHEFTTEAVTRPVVTIADAENWTFDGSDTIVSVTVGTDNTNVAGDATWTAVIYRDNNETPVATYTFVGNPEGTTVSDVTFTGIDFSDGSAYTIEVHALCDLNEEVGVGAEDTVLASRTFIDAQN